MIWIKEDISRILDEYKELEERIIEVAKELGIVNNQYLYRLFTYDKENDMIILRITDNDYQLFNESYTEFPATCLFSKYDIQKYKEKLTIDLEE